jgi:hypothetical protein
MRRERKRKKNGDGLERLEWLFPLKGWWLRYSVCWCIFVVGLLFMVFGSALPNPPIPLLPILFFLGLYMCVRVVIYTLAGK